MANNACPSGANYINPATGAAVTLASFGVNICWYVAANGLDTNTGADEQHPFLHAPGMPNCSGNCSLVHLIAGVGIILRGGDTWHFGITTDSPGQPATGHSGNGGWNI